MRAVVASDSVEQQENLRVLVLGAGMECGAADCVPLEKLTERLLNGPAELAFVDLDSTTAIEIIQQATNKSHTPILAIGPSHESKMIMQVMRSGAQEFLDRDNLRQELVAVLDKLRKVGTVKSLHGQTISVIGSNPGCGVTSVASNLAFAIQQISAEPTALAELGCGVPELALALDVKPTHSVSDMLAVWNRLDPTLLRRALIEHANGVQLLTYAPGTFKCEEMSPDALRQICVLLRSMFRHAVLDMGHMLNDATHEALRLSDKVVLVVRMDAPALNLTSRYVRRLTDQNIHADKLVIVGNRYGQRRQISWKKVEEVLRLPVQTWIPDDAAAMNDSLNTGKPLFVAAPRTTITKRFSELAQQLVAKPK